MSLEWFWYMWKVDSANYENCLSCGLVLVACQVFDILPQWVIRLGLIACSCLLNLKLDYAIYIDIYKMSFRTLKWIDVVVIDFYMGLNFLTCVVMIVIWGYEL